MIYIYIHFPLEKEIRKIMILKKRAETLGSIIKLKAFFFAATFNNRSFLITCFSSNS